LASHVNSDRISMSVEMAEALRERVMYMPFSSNPLNDHAVMSSYVPELEHASPPVYTRKSLGLPDAAFIFANFNNPYKLDAAGARAWAAALAGAGRGVIWMPEWEGLEATSLMLRQLLQSEGVTWNAVVTTPLLPRENHLLGRQLSDVRTAFPVPQRLFHPFLLRSPCVTDLSPAGCA
jgi:predicted O-linked N-acetylglucosamine transferase (SPINDLY family)